MTVVTEAPGRSPIVGPIARTSASAVELRDAMRSMSVQHEVEPLRGSLNGLATGARLGDVGLAFVRYGAPTRVVAEPTGSLVCWCAPLGTMGVSTGTSREHPHNEGFLLSSESSTTMVPSPRRGAVVVTTTTDRLTRHLGDLIGRADPPTIVIGSGASAPGSDGLLDSAWRHAARVLRSAPGLRGQWARLEELLLTSMLLELPTGATTQLSGCPTNTLGGEHAARAVDWLDDHLGETITMSGWAAASGLSVRHLQRVFREVHDCSPGEYVVMARLERAHRLLSTAPAERTVTSIAVEAGFTHMGRFAALYRERFGTVPSQTRP